MSTEDTIKPDLVLGLQLSPSSIADIAGVSRSLVSRWRNAGPGSDFPDPVGGTAQRPLFAAVPVVTWLAEHGKWDNKRFVQQIPGIVLKQLAESLEGAPLARWQTGRWLLETACLAKMAVLVGTDLDEKSTVEQVRDAGTNAANVNVVWREVLQEVPPAARPALAQVEASGTDVDVLLTIVEQMLVIAARASFLSRIEEYGQQVVADFLRVNGARTSKAIARSRERTTALLIEQAAAQVADVPGATVVDPCAGIGDVLLGIADELGVGTSAKGPGAVRLVGLESDGERVRVARQRAFLAGVEVDVRHHDAIRDEPQPELQADLVVAASYEWLAGGEDLAQYASAIKPNDPRWSSGIPSGESAWLMVALALLKEGGWAFVAASAGILKEQTESSVTRALIGRGCVGILTVGSAHDVWSLSRSADREHVMVTDLEAESWSPTDVTSADGLVRIDWLVQNWSPEVRSRLVERSKVSPLQFDVQLDKAAGRVAEESASLREALGDVSLTADVTEILRRTESANRATVAGLVKSGHLEIVGVGARNETAVELLSSDILVRLNDGIQAELGPASVRLEAKSFVLRVHKTQELRPHYLQYALAGLANEVIREDQDVPRLVDRLKLFEVPMLKVDEQLALARAIAKVELLRAQIRLADLAAEELQRCLIDSIRFGAAVTSAAVTSADDNKSGETR